MTSYQASLQWRPPIAHFSGLWPYHILPNCVRRAAAAYFAYHYAERVTGLRHFATGGSGIACFEFPAWRAACGALECGDPSPLSRAPRPGLRTRTRYTDAGMVALNENLRALCLPRRGKLQQPGPQALEQSHLHPGKPQRGALPKP